MAKSKGLARTSVDALLTETAGKVPGGKTALAVIQAAFRNRAAERAQVVFTQIAVETGARDWEAAAEQMAEHVGKPWFDEALEAGFREIMDCLDADARKCVAALVAEYVVNEKPPDVVFRRVGAILRDSDGEMLKTLQSITHGYAEVMKEEPTGMRVLLRTTPRPDSNDEVWIFAFRGGEHAVSKHFKSPGNLDACVGVLAGNAVGSLWTGLSSAQFQGNPLLRFADDDDATMVLLHTCISAALRPHEDTAAGGAG